MAQRHHTRDIFRLRGLREYFLFEHLYQQMLDFPTNRFVAAARHMGISQDKLNEDQLRAVRHISHRVSSELPTITLVDGPPGTGKTRVITNLLLQVMYAQMLNKPRKLLVCAHSDAAVDVICRQLLRTRNQMDPNDSESRGPCSCWQLTHALFVGKTFKVMRYGSLDKMHPSVRHLSVQEMSKNKNPLKELCEERGYLKAKIKARKIQIDANSPTPIGASQQLEVDLLEARLARLENAIERSDQVDKNCGTSTYRYWLSKADIICTTIGCCVSLMQ